MEIVTREERMSRASAKAVHFIALVFAGAVLLCFYTGVLFWSFGFWARVGE